MNELVKHKLLIQLQILTTWDNFCFNLVTFLKLCEITSDDDPVGYFLENILNFPLEKFRKNLPY